MFRVIYQDIYHTVTKKYQPSCKQKMMCVGLAERRKMMHTHIYIAVSDEKKGSDMLIHHQEKYSVHC